MSDDDDDGQAAAGVPFTEGTPGVAADGERGSHHKVEHDPPDPPPAMVAKYLSPGELRSGVIAVRRHWIVLALPALALVGGFLVAVIVNSVLYADHQASSLPVHVLWILWIAGALWSAWRYANWRVSWFVITGGQLMTIDGLLTQKVTPLPLKRVRDMELKQSPLGKQLGFGTLECESISTDHALHTVQYVPAAIELWRAIWSLLLPDISRGVRFGGMADDPW
jgi:membrane protein YdbS with pleckstrin-like domain